MLTVQYSQSFAEEGFTFVAVSPGVSTILHLFCASKPVTDTIQQWVQTDLGGPTADLTIEQGSKAVSDIVFRVGKEDTGKFFNIHVAGWEHAEGINQYDGACPPW